MRIVCLSAEAAEICFRLDAEEDVVGVSVFAPKRPEKKVVSGFSSGNVKSILGTNPELVITFSDVQAGLAESLIRAGVPVLALNHFTVDGVAESIRLLGRVLNRQEAGERVAAAFLAELERLTYTPQIRPRVYFEEWDEPMITGLPWISEIIQRAGGEDVFKGRLAKKAEQRVVQNDEIVAANPEIIFASWCGKPVNVESIRARKGFSNIDAVRQGEIHEIAPDKILQAGPNLALGLQEMAQLIRVWEGGRRGH